MVFIICSIFCGEKIIKDWFGFKYSDTKTLNDLYNEPEGTLSLNSLSAETYSASHASGDETRQFSLRRIEAMIGRNKHSWTKVDPSLNVGHVKCHFQHLEIEDDHILRPVFVQLLNGG